MFFQPSIQPVAIINQEAAASHIQRAPAPNMSGSFASLVPNTIHSGRLLDDMQNAVGQFTTRIAVQSMAQDNRYLEMMAQIQKELNQLCESQGIHSDASMTRVTYETLSANIQTLLKKIRGRWTTLLADRHAYPNYVEGLLKMEKLEIDFQASLPTLKTMGVEARVQMQDRQKWVFEIDAAYRETISRIQSLQNTRILMAQKYADSNVSLPHLSREIVNTWWNIQALLNKKPALPVNETVLPGLSTQEKKTLCEQASC